MFTLFLKFYSHSLSFTEQSIIIGYSTPIPENELLMENHLVYHSLVSFWFQRRVFWNDELEVVWNGREATTIPSYHMWNRVQPPGTNYLQRSWQLTEVLIKIQGTIRKKPIKLHLIGRYGNIKHIEDVPGNV